jgi:ABC-2 type transport system permease protein
MAEAGELREGAASEPEAATSPPRRSVYDVLWRSGLLNVGTIARREIGSYFVSPLGWVVGSLLILIVSLLGYFFGAVGQDQASLDSVFSLLPLLMVFLLPLFTMRQFAEEKRSGTLEMLLTSPIRDLELVIGKWLGTFVYYLALIAFTLVYVLLLVYYYPTKAAVHPLGLNLSLAALDYGQLIASYVAMILMGAMFSAIGVLMSSLTQNQIIAAVSAVAFLLVLWYVTGRVADFEQPPVRDFLQYLSGEARAADFTRGQVPLRDIVYFLSITVGALFLTTRILESRKWR